MKILICEDELLAQNRLVKIITSLRPNFEIIGTSQSAVEGLDLIRKKDPDLIFMDIELADGSAFEYLKNSNLKKPIIFTTAYDEYALKAFKFNSIDYLLKPISADKVEQAIIKFENLKISFKVNSSDEKDFFGDVLEQKVKEILNKRESSSIKKRISIKNNGVISLTDISDILWIKSDGNYINLITKDKKFLYRSTLSGFLRKLDNSKFFRVHKSIVINIEHVSHVEESENNDYKVIMKNGEVLKMSRNYKSLLNAV